MSVITGKSLVKALLEAGVIRVEDRVRRVVIDVDVKDVPLIYVERYGDERLIEVVPALVGVEVRPTPAEAHEISVDAMAAANEHQARTAGHD